MSDPGLLPPDAIATLADALPGWEVRDGRLLVLRRRFDDFDAALGFVRAVAALAQARDHHPDLAFGWGWAECRLTTHAAGGLTRRDVTLASEVSGIVPAAD